MSCCGDNSLFNNNINNKKIKFVCNASGASLAITQGSSIVGKVDLCSWSKPYNQYVMTDFYLESGALNREIPFSAIGTQIQFLMIKVKYIDKNPSSPFTSSSTEIPYLSYTFQSNPLEIRYIDDLMILTGSSNHRIPKVYLSNPTNGWNAMISIIASTESITYDNINPETGDKVITVENLTYKNLTSDVDKLYINSTAGTVVTMRWQDITTNSSSGDVELNNKIITIQDYVKGKINLSFIDDYNARQSFSLIKWALCNKSVNLLVGNGNTTDDIAPTIIYSENFTTDIYLNDFPPIISSTCGVYGTSMCFNPYMGTNGENIILKDDLFTFLVDDVSDNRDCYVPFNKNNLSIKYLTSTNTIDAITSLGIYQISFEVKDYAGNINIDSYILNIKDTNAPKLIVSELGLDIINNSTSGDYYTVNNNDYINYDNSSSFNFKCNINVGEYSYVIIDNYVIEIHTYVQTGVQYIVFDNLMVGNGKLIWNTNTDINVNKIFLLNSIQYNIVWQGFGSLLFNLSLTNISPSPNQNNIVDENNNNIIDENGNILSF